jgi:hypothetical protein
MAPRGSNRLADGLRSATRAGRSGNGAQPSLPGTPATVSYLIPLRTLPKGDWAGNPCPLAAVHNTRRDRLIWVDCCPSRGPLGSTVAIIARELDRDDISAGSASSAISGTSEL